MSHGTVKVILFYSLYRLVIVVIVIIIIGSSSSSSSIVGYKRDINMEIKKKRNRHRN